MSEVYTDKEIYVAHPDGWRIRLFASEFCVEMVLQEWSGPNKQWETRGTSVGVPTEAVDKLCAALVEMKVVVEEVAG